MLCQPFLLQEFAKGSSGRLMTGGVFASRLNLFLHHIEGMPCRIKALLLPPDNEPQRPDKGKSK